MLSSFASGGTSGSEIFRCAHYSCYDLGAGGGSSSSPAAARGFHAANLQSLAARIQVPFDVGIGTYDNGGSVPNNDDAIENPDGDLSRFWPRMTTA